MKTLLAACCLALLAGCATVNNRVFNESIYSPYTEPYQSTSDAIAGCTFIAVPQAASLGPTIELCWLNIISVPIGVCCFIVDVPLEAVSDTLWYPFDKYQENKRKEEQK